ncbi:MAG: carbohydrate binding family 9 domain-containing protein, partial [Hydrococcus sp. RU_2_2]|nr:carbohydrate binding family 9 domain-containing protein [Hydrococcus sp. RU_2_2]
MFANFSFADDSRLKITNTDTPPTIDGVLSPDEWKSAAKTELGFQKEPQENDQPTERTEVFLMFDKENLYVAFHAFDSTPSAIRAPISKRDSVGSDDFVSIWLDTYDDRRRTYAFRFNPLGIQEDGIFTQADVGNLSWDGILESKGNLTGDGYIVEAKIPFKTLRYQINKEKTWGLHLFRWIARKAERSTWAKTSLANSDLLSQMGTLQGIDDIFSGRTLDIIPTLTLSNNGERELHNDVPTLNTVNRLDAGVTVNYSITPNLTLAATVNP